MSRAHVLKWITYPNTVADRLSGYAGRVHGRPFGPSGRGNRTDRRNGGGRTRRSRAPGGRSDARSSSVSVPPDEFCTVETPGTSRPSADTRCTAPALQVRAPRGGDAPLLRRWSVWSNAVRLGPSRPHRTVELAHQWGCVD